MLKLPKSISDSALGNIKYRNNVVTGVIAVNNGNNTYDVYINSEDTAFPNVPTTVPESSFSVGDAVEILMEYGNLEMPIIIGYSKKVTQNFTEVEVNYAGGTSVVTLDAYSITAATAYLEGRISIAEMENCTKRGFYYGQTTAYGSDTYTTGSFAAGSYALQTTGLSANTTYNFCAYVYDADGDEQSGDNKTFITLADTISYYLFSADYGTDVISKHQGKSETILATWSAVDGEPNGGLTNDGSNLIEVTEYLARGRVNVHYGASSGISSQFLTPGFSPSGAAYDGTNLITVDITTDLIYKHIGMTSGVSDSFAAPDTNPSGLTVIGGNLISCDKINGNIYVHIGITSGITSTFAAPEPYPSGLGNDGTNLISGNYGTTGDNKIYIHSGITSGITQILNAPAGYTDIRGVTYFST